MIYRQDVPQELQLMYNCSYMEWDSERGWFWTVQECDNLARVWTTGHISFEEFHSIMADLEDYWDSLREEYAAYYEELPEDITEHECLI